MTVAWGEQTNTNSISSNSNNNSEIFMDTSSVASEDSAAIVSLYNSWSASDCSSTLDDDDVALIGDEASGVGSDDLTTLDLSNMMTSRTTTLFLMDQKMTMPCNAEELLERLKKRCRKEDLPPLPRLRPGLMHPQQQHQQPLCRYVNHFDKTSSQPPQDTKPFGSSQVFGVSVRIELKQGERETELRCLSQQREEELLKQHKKVQHKKEKDAAPTTPPKRKRKRSRR